MLTRQGMEVHWGGAPHSQLYESRASLTTLVDRKLVVPLGAAPRHGAHLARQKGIRPPGPLGHETIDWCREWGTIPQENEASIDFETMLYANSKHPGNLVQKEGMQPSSPVIGRDVLSVLRFACFATTGRWSPQTVSIRLFPIENRTN